MADNPTNSQTNQEVVSQGKGKTEIRRTVAGLTNFHQNSMIFKNVVNSVRIIKLKSILFWV